jgi:hypothetical protein
MRRLPILLALMLVGCFDPGSDEDAIDPADLATKGSALSAAQRVQRAGQIRDAAFAAGMTEGYLLAGIADSETGMSQCWSELTWACQGPASADCGGGPVVAGAGDGPCADRQGGLGMFQFDAGTYDQTLAREGDRILSIAGNTQAAVDFVVAMVIRSVYISGVDTREQAIAWMNGVRVGNDRWDAWITTVTHYYNGCTPSASCFSSRYARYRDHTANIMNEMGASFWSVSHEFSAQWVSQSFPLASQPFELYPGQEVPGFIEMRNTGTATWQPGVTNLGTTEPRDVASPFAGPDWLGPNRPATIDRAVAPNEVGRFNFTVRAPAAAGDYPQYFNLVQEGVAWFSNQGGPPDNLLQVRVTVIPAPTCADGTPSTWTCSGSERVRCDLGNVVREACAYGCVSGECAAPPADGDADGFTSDADCDDANAEVYPGAPERCADGIDQDCDGADALCIPGTDGAIADAGAEDAPDGGIVTTRPHTLTGTCAASPGRSSAAWPLAIGLVLLAWRRRRSA